MRIPGTPDPAVDREAFAVRCSARERERQLGTGYGFGIFVDGEFAGEINLNVRAAGPVPERLRRLLDRRGARGQRLHARGGRRRAVRYAFEELGLHRLQIAIIPRNTASRRVVEKLELREEGIGAALPRDQRRVGGPRPLRHHRRGVGRAARRAGRRLDCSASAPQLFDEIFACSAARRSANQGCCVDQTWGSSSRPTAASCRRSSAIVGERLP